MAPHIYSTSFYVGTIPHVETLVIPASAYTQVLLDLEVELLTSTADVLYVYFRDPVGANIAGFKQDGTEPGSVQWTGGVVIPPGSTVVAGSDGEPWTLIASGWLLAPP